MLKKVFSFVGAVCLWAISTNAQSPVESMNLSPAIDWKHEFQYDQSPLADEDWYYDVIEYEVGGQPAGYVAVGFSWFSNKSSLTFEDDMNNEIECISRENGTTLDCEQLEVAANRKKGFGRQMVVFYDLDGNVTKEIRLNVGDLYTVWQDGNYLYLGGDCF